MATDYIEIGCAPVDEDCAQVGEKDFRSRATREMNAFINQLRREFPEIENTNLILRKRWFNHDFGAYGYVVAEFFTDDTEAVDLAYAMEANTPLNWDEEALKELAQEGNS